MLIAEDLLLLLTDDRFGRSGINSQGLGLGLGGAVLVELVLAGRVTVTDPGRWRSGSRVTVVPSAPTDDPLLDSALQRIAGHRQPVAAQWVVTTLSKGIADALRSRLVARGILREEERRAFGIFPRRTWPAADSTYEARVRAALWDVIGGGRTPTDREVALVSLLHAMDQVPHQFAADGWSARQLRARAKALSEGNVGGEAVRRAISATNDAVLLAMTASTAAAASAATTT